MNAQSALILVLLISCQTGCSDPSPPKNGVDVQAPGVRVKVDDDKVKVNAPGVHVDTKKGDK